MEIFRILYIEDTQCVEVSESRLAEVDFATSVAVIDVRLIDLAARLQTLDSDLAKIEMSLLDCRTAPANNPRTAFAIALERLYLEEKRDSLRSERDFLQAEYGCLRLAKISYGCATESKREGGMQRAIAAGVTVTEFLRARSCYGASGDHVTQTKDWHESMEFGGFHDNLDYCLSAINHYEKGEVAKGAMWLRPVCMDGKPLLLFRTLEPSRRGKSTFLLSQLLADPSDVQSVDRKESVGELPLEPVPYSLDLFPHDSLEFQLLNVGGSSDSNLSDTAEGDFEQVRKEAQRFQRNSFLERRLVWFIRHFYRCEKECLDTSAQEKGNSHFGAADALSYLKELLRSIFEGVKMIRKRTMKDVPARFQVELRREELDEMERLRELGGLGSKKELLNNALTLLKWAVRQKQQGYSIASVDENGDIRRELEMPYLENIRVEPQRILKIVPSPATEYAA